MKFNDYYQHYLSLHQNKWCRRLHVLGQMTTLFYLGLVLTLCFISSWWFLPLLVFLPFIVYPFAWSGHFLFEHNKPAAFSNPWMAKLSDWVMLYDICRGKIPL